MADTTREAALYRKVSGMLEGQQQAATPEQPAPVAEDHAAVPQQPVQEPVAQPEAGAEATPDSDLGNRANRRIRDLIAEKRQLEERLAALEGNGAVGAEGDDHGDPGKVLEGVTKPEPRPQSAEAERALREKELRAAVGELGDAETKAVADVVEELGIPAREALAVARTRHPQLFGMGIPPEQRPGPAHHVSSPRRSPETPKKTEREKIGEALGKAVAMRDRHAVQSLAVAEISRAFRAGGIIE